MYQEGVITDLDLFSPSLIAKLPYYQEFLAPHGLRWFAGIRISAGDDLWTLSLPANDAAGGRSPQPERKISWQAGLSEQLSTVAAITRALGASVAAGVLDAFETSGTAIVLINRHGGVFKVNGSAERLLVGEVKIRKGYLVSSDESATNKLGSAVRELLKNGRAGMSTPIALPRRGRRPVIAYPGRLSSLASNALADCQAIVILVDPDARPKPWGNSPVYFPFGVKPKRGLHCSWPRESPSTEMAARQGRNC